MANENLPLEHDPTRRPHLADDPQMEHARAWWQRHGRAIVGGITLGLAAVVGFNYWQGYQQSQAESAFVLYDQLRGELQSREAARAAAADADDAAEEAETAEAADDDDAADDDTVTDATEDATDDDAEETETTDATDDDATDDPIADTTDDDTHDHAAADAHDHDTDDTDDTDDTTDTTDAANPNIYIESLAADLMENYGATPYATHAAFALAKAAVETDRLPQAADALRWALDNAADSTLQHIARLRLSAVLLAQQNAADALDLLGVADTAGFTARYAELRGDAHQQQGDTTAARDAYQQSIEALSGGAGEVLVKLKLDALGG